MFELKRLLWRYASTNVDFDLADGVPHGQPELMQRLTSGRDLQERISPA
jgi:hypothetical protein